MATTPSFFKNWFALRRFRRLKKRIDTLSHVPDSFAQDAVAGEKEVISEQVDQVLSLSTAEVLKKYKTGARLQPISHYSIKELDRFSASQIANIRGIGPKSATSIKKCVSIYTQEVMQSERLRLSPSNPTKKASNLVKNLYQIDNLNALAEESRFIRDSSFGEQGLYKKARAAAHPIRWLFTKDKAASLESIGQIHELLQSPLEVEIAQLEGKRAAILKVEHDT